MRRKTKALTTILDEMIAKDVGGYNTMSIHVMIAAFTHLSDLTKQGFKIDVDDVDDHHYFKVVADRKEFIERTRLARERASGRFMAKARQHARWSPHHDYWSYKAREALTVH